MSAAGDTDRKSDELTPSQINMHITTHKTEGRLSAACFKKKNSSRSPNNFSNVAYFTSKLPAQRDVCKKAFPL